MQILVWENKYGANHCSAKTEVELQASALVILKELVQDGWIFEPAKPDPNDRWSGWDESLTELSEEEVAGLPKALHNTVVQERRKRDRELRNYANYKAEFNLANAIAEGKQVYRKVKTREGAIAYRRVTPWSILQDRDGAEYENYSLITVGETEVPKEWKDYTKEAVSELPDGAVLTQL